ncbi:MAG TPA: EamA family transporter [Xanthobacteraceae bacterium]|nr:EamA family transporter [Xanthobacteraceae bacterium]
MNGGAAGAAPGWRAYGHLGVVYLVWGSVYLTVKIAITQPGGFAVFQLQATRLLLGGALLGAFAAFTSGFRITNGRDVAVCAAGGILLWVGGNSLAAIALQDLPSGLVAMAIGTVPLWTVAAQALIERRRPSYGRMAALGVGFIGLGFIIVPLLGAAGGRHLGAPSVTSVVALLLAPLLWVGGTLVQRGLRGEMDSVVAASFQLLFGGLGALAVMLLQGDHGVASEPLRPVAILAMLYLAVVASAVSFRSYLIAVRSLPAHIVSTFAYVNPVVGLALGWLVLGEEPALSALLGMAIILASVGLLLTRR